MEQLSIPDARLLANFPNKDAGVEADDQNLRSVRAREGSSQDFQIGHHQQANQQGDISLVYPRRKVQKISSGELSLCRPGQGQGWVGHQEGL